MTALDLRINRNPLVIEILGYVGAVLVGMVIGLLGGGGAILAVPLLVYVLGVEAGMATGYSLFIVGFTALVGSFRYWIHRQVNHRAAFYFLVPSVIFVYITRSYLVPGLPESFNILGINMSKGSFLMLVFAMVMMIAGISMISGRVRLKEGRRPPPNVGLWVSIWGSVVGFLAGLVGAGGGFMIVPVLVLFMRLPMKTAVGTSLVVIAGQSLTGFAGALRAHEEISWKFLILFTLLSLGGMWIGSFIAYRSKSEKLRKLFGWFVILMGVMIVLIESLK